MKLAIVVGHNSANLRRSKGGGTPYQTDFAQFAVFVVGALHMGRYIIDDRGDKAAWR